jgi:hypothetical protein
MIALKAKSRQDDTLALLSLCSDVKVLRSEKEEIT